MNSKMPICIALILALFWCNPTSSWAASGTVQLLVEDEGEGIPEDQRAEVFSPYSRLERDRDSGIAGSGIGLAVVRELAQRQGASVKVGDSVSGGARFVVAFPRGDLAPTEG